MRLLSLLLLLTPAAALTQQQQPIIDGQLTEPFWQQAPAQPMAPGTGGDVRLVVSGRTLFAGIRMPEPSGRFTARSLGRNPHWEEEDLVRVTAGAYPDFTVIVGPLGAWGIETKGVPVFLPHFLGAATRHATGWTAEVALPMNDFRAARPGEITVTIERIRAARPGEPERHYRWPALGVAGRLPPALNPDTAPAPRFQPAPLGNREPPIEVGRTGAAAAGEEGGEPLALLRHHEPQPRAPRAPTTVQLSHNGAGATLTVTARCTNRGDTVAPSDSFGLYLSTTGSTYAQIFVDPSGTITEAAGLTGGQRISRPRTDWRSGARALILQSDAQSWTVRLDIPLAPFAAILGEAQPPREWRVLFVRSRPGVRGELSETSVLPAVHTATLVCPARYRRMVLVDRAPSAAAAAIPSPAPSVHSPPILPSSGRAMIDRQQRERTRVILAAERRAWDQVTSRETWEQRFRQPRLAALRQSLGEFPARVPLSTIVSKEYQGVGYRRQDLVYQTRPGLWVTANLYLPSPARALQPALVIVHSHHRPRTQSELQDMGLLWARAGAAVLIMDQIGAGERLQNYPWNREAYHSRYILNMQLGLAGESLMQWMVWDILRGVDLLLEHPGLTVDPRRIGILGAVAGGGDPAAVAAALDERISLVAPFNYGESTPEHPRFMPDKNVWPHELAEPSDGSWEWTRNLPRSTVDQFLPWFVCASVAPRRFIYSFEMGWQVEDLPAWQRYRRVFGFYNALDNLEEAHGFGPFPGPGECTNIGPAQRHTLYPELERWFGLPPPVQEPADRRPESELAALTPETARRIAMRPVHTLAAELARQRLARARTLPLGELRTRLAAKLGGNIAPDPAPPVVTTPLAPRTESMVVTVEPGIDVPALLLLPAAEKAGGEGGRLPVVVGVAQGGREQFLAHRAADLAHLRAQGIAVCLVDVRGTGETAPDPRRGPNSTGIAQAATELLLGNTMLGARLKDLRTVLAHLAARPDLDPSRLAIWGESFTPPNGPIVLDELPAWQIGPDPQHQAEPLGDLLALLAALYEGDRVKAIVTSGGLTSFASLLDSPFAYVPQDIIVPGLLEVADIADLLRALGPKPIVRTALVDARNRPSVATPPAAPSTTLTKLLLSR